MSLPSVNTFGKLHLIHVPLVTQPCVAWHGRIVKAFQDSPKNFCDLMQRIGTVALGILVYPTLGVICFFSLFCQPSQHKVEEIRKETLNDFQKELNTWKKILSEDIEPPATVYYRIKVLGKEMKGSVKATDKTSFPAEITSSLREQFDKTLKDVDLGQYPDWNGDLLIVRKESNRTYSIIQKDRYIKGDTIGGGESQSTGVRKEYVHLYIKDFNN